MSVDGSGNVYVVGDTRGTLPDQTSVGGDDAYVRKYDGFGKELWTHQFGTSVDDIASSVSVDESGNVYVVGYTNGSLPSQTSVGGTDAYVRKYDSSGKELWTKQFGTTADDRASSVMVDGSGNIYVAGQTSGALPDQTSVGGTDAYVRKYDSSGKELWTKQFGTNKGDGASSVSVDESGNVYVAGGTLGTFSGQTSAGYFDAFARKYDSFGKELWTKQFGTNEQDGASSLSVDGNGNVYVVGYAMGTLSGQTNAGGHGAYMRKYDGSGKELWTQQFGVSTTDSASSVNVDGSGNIYVAGHTLGALTGQTNAGSFDAYVRKYDGSGKELWTRQFGTSVDDRASSACVERSGGVLVAGFTNGTLPGQTNAGLSDAFVLRMNP